MALTDLIDFRLFLISALIFIPLEQLIPHESNQRFFRRHLLNDLVFVVANGFIIKIGLLAVIATIMLAAATVMPTSVGLAVKSQPLWLQVIETLILADLGFYFAHRAFHAFPFLWRFHAVHHSIEEMDWIAAHRVHPVDQVLTKGASFLPIFVLGFSPAAIAIFTLIYHWQSLLIHSNVKINFGPLRWLVASPLFHHWHHANEKQAYDKNFAGQLPFIDAVMGTLYMPDQMPKKYGTDDPVPTVYHKQLAYPFLPRRSEEQSEIGRASGEGA